MLYHCHWPHAGDAIPPYSTLSPGHSPFNYYQCCKTELGGSGDATICMHECFFDRAACFHDVLASVYSDVLYPSSSCFQVSGIIFAVCFVWTNHSGVLLVL